MLLIILLSSIIIKMAASIRLILLLAAVGIVRTDNYCGVSDCYELLGVARDADEVTIKKAYR